MRHPAPRAARQKEELDAALCRCVLWEALALGLYAPTHARLERLGTKETGEVLRDAARRLEARAANVAPTPSEAAARMGSTAPSSYEQAPRLVERVEALTRYLENGLGFEQVEARYGRLFGHTARGAVCPYESEFGAETHFQQTARLARLGGFYAAFGLVPSEDVKERLDHVCHELEFVAFLARKEAFALEERDDAMLTETRKAYRLFLRDHLGRFARAFARQLSQHDAGNLHGRLADVLFELVSLECARIGVSAGAAFVQLRPTEEDDVSMDCGGCDVTRCASPEGWVGAS